MVVMWMTLLWLLFPAQAAEVPEPEPAPTPVLSQTVESPPLARLTLDPSMLERSRRWHNAARAGGIVLLGGTAIAVVGVAYLVKQLPDDLAFASLGGTMSTAGLLIMASGLATYTLSTAASTRWLRRAGVQLSKVPILVAVLSLGASALTLGTVAALGIGGPLRTLGVLGRVGFSLAGVMTTIQFVMNGRSLKKHPVVSIAPLIDRHTRGLALAMQF